MEAFNVALLLIVSVVVSSALARISPVALPVPFVQIGLGAVLAAVNPYRIELDPETFLLFLAPLLFLDGWRTPKDGFRHNIGSIAALAFGLVFFTVIGAGYFIHWLLPAMPLAVAFALAAAISPTDAVAVSAIISKVPVPKRFLHVIEGESLLNDASGLVCMRFAIAAAASGSFSLGEAAITFGWVAAFGTLAGLIVALLATAGKDWLSRRFGEEPGSQILASLLIPFGAYSVAEAAGASGILAAVAAGVVMSYEESAGRALAITRLQRRAVWDALQYAGNGAIFVLLGQQIPGIFARATAAVSETGHMQEAWLAAYVIAIFLALLLLRALWAWGLLHLTLLRDGWARPAWIGRHGWRMIAAAALSGARGAVTLAGILSLPLALDDGSPFPARDLAILLATGVIVVSLVAARIGLPFVMRNVTLSAEPSYRSEERDARNAAAQAAIAALENRRQDHRVDVDTRHLHSEAALRLIHFYRERVESRGEHDFDVERAVVIDGIERDLRLLAIRAERSELYRILHGRDFPEELGNRLIHELDILELRFSLK